MLVRYLLDTNIVSYFLQRQMPQVSRRFQRATTGAIAISTITEAEVLYGLACKPGALHLRVAAELFLASVERPPWDSAAARSYAALRLRQRHKGRSLSAEDLMIAAHALSLGLVLVTHDKAFSHVDGLRTEDWTIE